jgi:hypothetical protein
LIAPLLEAEVMRRTLSVVAIAALAALATGSVGAQVVSVSGVVRVPFEPPIVQCGMPVNVLQVENTEVYLTSSTINVGQLTDLNVKVTGTLLPLPCTVIDVASFVPAPFVLETCGGGSLGCPFRVNVSSPGSGIMAMFAALDPGFVPTGPVAGSLLLDPLGFNLVFTFAHTQPLHTFDFVIPDDSSLQVMTFHLQAGRVDAQKPGVIQWSSPDIVFTGTHTTVCLSSDC